MGVYHLMGLGTSPGAVTAPLSYLAHRYQRWEKEDQDFFVRSGEAKHRAENKKSGDVQALVLFTTTEVLEGQLFASPFIQNQPGITLGKQIDRAPMKQVLSDLFAEVLPNISERSSVDVFWCAIDRRDINNVYERVIRVVAALCGVGGQGKEMWANLTGGNNVTNFALELAATLSGQIARLYYVQAQNTDAEKCVHYSTEDRYWVDLPAMPLSLGQVTYAILDILKLNGKLNASELYSRLLAHERYWSLVQGISPENFHGVFLSPMWKQGLIVGEDLYDIGAQWELIQPFERQWQSYKDAGITIEQLAKSETWITHQELSIKK